MLSRIPTTLSALFVKSSAFRFGQAVIPPFAPGSGSSGAFRKPYQLWPMSLCCETPSLFGSSLHLSRACLGKFNHHRFSYGV
jgi:hypothetical protein